VTALAACRRSFAAGLVILACETPSDVAPPPYAALLQTCAPWDGPAVALFLTDVPAAASYPPPPYSAITIHRGIAAVLGHGFEVGSETRELGFGQICPADDECRPARSASITFSGMNADSTVQVAYRFELAQGGILKGKARARFHPEPALCG